jgi:hypothetical protein
MATPYINVQTLLNAPSGVAWDIIPEPQASAGAQEAELSNVAWRATSMIDTDAQQVLRATVDNETLTGPGSARFGFQQGSGLGLLYMRRWPVTEVLGIQMSWNRSFPRVWSTIAAQNYDINHPLINSYADTASATAPDGGSSILVNPCALYPAAAGGSIYAPARTWGAPRNSLRLIVSYVNGWPHTSLAESVDAGATSISVDDVTGWTGAQGFAYDGASTEPISVTAVSANSPVELPNGIGTAQSGPGTLTLASPLSFSHAAGVLTSSLPAGLMQAAILACAIQAMDAGIESISVQTVSGSQTTGGNGIDALRKMYWQFLNAFIRVI